ncbi:hypothetical protein BV898_16623 [Hypsibius exemplaris]|uniref:Receptor ligand binding region domain-containing protein n=1 Tax=Hypsibius exemplaris TaxID=2072580 RepID=A0A9X6NG74_HYPEX|nr:hypothetical protein BV898_16623 [Hypsibius exemplaris]
MGVVLSEGTFFRFDSRNLVTAMDLAVQKAFTVYNIEFEPFFCLSRGTECSTSFALPSVVTALNASVNFIVALMEYMRKNRQSPYDYPVKGSEVTGFKKADAIHDDASLEARVILFLISPKIIRQLLIQAQWRGICNGDYAFFLVDIFKTDFISPQNGATDLPCHALFVLSLSFSEKDAAFKAFAQQVRGNVRLPADVPPIDVTYYSTTFHDALLIYAAVLNETIADGRDMTKDNVKYLADKFKNRTFKGCIGPLYMDGNGNHAADFKFYQAVRGGTGANATRSDFSRVAQYMGSRGVYKPIQPIQWLGADNTGYKQASLRLRRK